MAVSQYQYIHTHNTQYIYNNCSQKRNVDKMVKATHISTFNLLEDEMRKKYENVQLINTH